MQIPSDLSDTLRRFQQEHLLFGWEQLDPPRRTELLRQIAQIDFHLLQKLLTHREDWNRGTARTDDRAARARPPQQIVRLPRSAADRERRQKALSVGEQLLREGSVGAILVAGGQGARLGFDAPKGTFPIGPLTERTLFQILCEQLLARSRKAGRSIPYFIMTSEATHAATIDFFADRKFFGLPREDVYFFQQSSLPAVADRTPRILLSEPGVVCRSPDGHGGMLKALNRHGLLEVMRERGIEQLYYHQVDNPTAIVCDPAFLGEHVLQQSDMSTKVVAKATPDEKMGVVVTVDGRTQIIEYSDLNPADVRRQDEHGNDIFWAGSTAIHAISRSFLERLAAEGIDLPYHVAHKPVAHLDEQGRLVPAHPDRPNAHKFEQFLFDALLHAEKALVVEADRRREFNPVKNRSGADSPETSRAAMNAIARSWIEQAGGSVAAGVAIEISPLFALDEQELAARLGSHPEFSTDTILHPDHRGNTV